MISGKIRKEKKKELHLLENYIKMFWYFEDICDISAASPEALDAIKKKKAQINHLKKQLNERIS